MKIWKEYWTYAQFAMAAMFFVFFAVSTSMGQRGTVYQLATGVMGAAPAPLGGASEAYLPIIMPSNHASNLLALPDGDLLCFWFAGTSEGESGVSIVMSRLDRGSNRWTQPVVLSHRAGWSNQNPVAFRDPSGKLWLFHTSQQAGKGQTTAVIEFLTSTDNGKTWTEPRILFPQAGSFDRQPLVIFEGQWLFPTYHSASRGIVSNAQNDHSVVKISKDSGKTWKDCDVPDSDGLVQMNILKLPGRHLIAFFRSRYADWIYESRSEDGCHWDAPKATKLPNNNASIQAVRLRDGHLAIAFNNAQAAVSRVRPAVAARSILSVALSEDGGKTWPWVRDLQAGAEPPTFYPGERVEYSYPSITQTANGKVAVSFTFRRETIKYLTFSEDWIKKGTSEGLFRGKGKR